MCKTHADTNRAFAERRRTSHPARLATFAGGFLLTVILVTGWGARSHAAIPQDDPFAGVEVLDAAEMTEKRGGFFDAVLGISLNLGADIFTSINNTLVMTTHVSINAGGTNVTHTTHVASLPGLTFLDSSGNEIAGIESQNFPGSVPISIDGGPTVTVPAGFQGLVAKSDSGGLVAAVNKISKEQFANLVINSNAIDPSSSDPLSIVKQELNIDIDVAGFAGLQQNVRLNATLTRFRDAMRSASLGALGAN